jgi:hypothetical protein
LPVIRKSRRLKRHVMAAALLSRLCAVNGPSARSRTR